MVTWQILLTAAMVILAVNKSPKTAEAAVTGPLSMQKLTWHYYKVYNTCENVENFVRHQVKLFYNKDKAIAPKLLRLLYSDCFVSGCDASILLEGPNSERTAPQNRGLGGFVIIDKIKVVLEQRCPGVVSCADILNLATRDAVHMAGAPSYPVFTGRRDGVRSEKQDVDLPSPSISWDKAMAYFESRGLNVLDMATLLAVPVIGDNIPWSSGSHSMGRTHCSYVVDRLYNFNNTGKPSPTIDKSFMSEMRKQCPPRTRKGQGDPLVYLNPNSGSNHSFTSSFYSRVLSNKSVLEVDQQLLYNDDTKQISQEFSESFEEFRKSFAFSMSKMGAINVLTKNEGEIRRDCRRIN